MEELQCRISLNKKWKTASNAHVFVLKMFKILTDWGTGMKCTSFSVCMLAQKGTSFFRFILSRSLCLQRVIWSGQPFSEANKHLKCFLLFNKYIIATTVWGEPFRPAAAAAALQIRQVYLKAERWKSKDPFRYDPNLSAVLMVSSDKQHSCQPNALLLIM